MNELAARLGTAPWLGNFVWDRYSQCNEFIYDGPAALAFGWTRSTAVHHNPSL